MKMKWKEFAVVLAGRLAFFAVDSAVMAVAYGLSFLLRFDFAEPWWGWQRVANSFVVVWLVQYTALILFRCHRMLWRFISVSDVPRFMGAVVSAALVLIGLRIAFPNGHGIRPPYSITLIDSILVFGGLLLVRFFWRMLQDGEVRNRDVSTRTKRVLLVGAGAAGSLVVRELRQQMCQKIYVVGFLDDDPAKQQARIQGCTVLGKIDDLHTVARRWLVDEIIVSMVCVPREVIRRVVRLCEGERIPVRILPAYHELIEGSVTVSRIREIDIADLLGREESKFDDTRIVELIRQKRVLITGAGGSIGRELVRQVSRMGPELLVLFERSEHALYEIDREIRETARQVSIVTLIGDVCDAVKVESVLAEYRPHLVIHAAAYKHVPMMELNAVEAIKNNVFGTRTLGELSVRYDVERFVLISTDKAVNPVSVMGMTKRLAERVICSLNQRKKTRFSAVRFGNVLGSSGSVVPLFREQIRKGGPVTVTHPEMKRYFMTLEESVHLVLQATALAKGGEIFVLDMGEPVKIVTLAEEMIRLSGFKPYEDIPIVFTGVRLGEKLFEELDVSEASVMRTENARIFIGKIRDEGEAEVEKILQTCEAVSRNGLLGSQEVRSAVRQICAVEGDLKTGMQQD